MAKLDYKNLTTPAHFTAAAASFTRRNTSIKIDMQHATICALKHMEAHGDYTTTIMPLIECAKSFGKNLHVAYMEYVLKYSWLALDGKAWAKDKAKVMDLTGAEATEWWTMEKAAKAQPFDFQKALEQLFDKVAAELAKPETTLDRSTVVNGIFAKLAPIASPEDQINSMFKRLNAVNQNDLLLELMSVVSPTETTAQSPAVEPTTEVEEPAQELAAA